MLVGKHPYDWLPRLLRGVASDFQCYEVGSDAETSGEGQAYFGSEEVFGMDQDSSDDENSLKENTDPNDDSDSTPLPAIQGPEIKKSFAIKPTNIVVNFEHLIELLSSLRCQCGSASSVLERRTIGIATQLFHKCTAFSKSFSIKPEQAAPTSEDSPTKTGLRSSRPLEKLSNYTSNIALVAAMQSIGRSTKAATTVCGCLGIIASTFNSRWTVVERVIGESEINVTN
jgi:hypothetical protein